MARQKCPSCGAPYNGKRCRSCSYENFSNETSCSVHHKEVVFDDGKTVSTAPRKHSDFAEQHPERIPDEAVEETYSQPKQQMARAARRRVNTILVCFIFFVAGVSLLSLILGNTRTVIIDPEPETISLPADGKLLYDADGLVIKADWQDGQEFAGDIPIIAENNTGRDLIITDQMLMVNGYMMRLSYLYCTPEDGSLYYGALRLDEEDLQNAGIETIQEISFYLDIYDAETYEDVAESETITLYADAPAGFTQPPIEDGSLFWENEEVTIRFLGYQADSYHTHDFWEGDFLFYIENNSSRQLDFYTAETQINGESVDLSMWCSVLPGARAVANIYLYSVKDLGISSLDQIKSLAFQLEMGDVEDWTYSIQTDLVSVSPYE